MNMRDLGLANKLVTFTDGISLLDYTDQILDSLEIPEIDGEQVSPIALVLVDINMHGADGIECVKAIKTQFM